jgi:hypothetical protein
MLQKRDGDTDEQFMTSLRGVGSELTTLARTRGVGIRIGTRHPMGIPSENVGEERRVRETLGAVEISVAEDEVPALVNHAGAFGQPLAEIAGFGTSVVAAGPVHHIVEPRTGRLFLSAAFRRDASISSDQFHDWWLNRHAPIAVAYLAPQLLAYDQVHVDAELSERASKAAGFAFEQVDAYDNLTWESFEKFVASMNKPGLVDAMLADEQGFIDLVTYIGSQMSVDAEFKPPPAG